MPEASSEERTESPSPKRRSEARKKGQVAKSTEVNSVLVLLTGLLLLLVLGPWMFRRLGALFRFSYGMIGSPDIGDVGVVNLFRAGVLGFATLCMPIVISILLVGLVANIMQIGFLFTLQPLVPKFEKINPISGFQRMFSLRSVVEALKSIFKILIIAVVAYLTIRGSLGRILTLSDTSVGAIWLFITQVGFKIVFRVSLVLVLLAILDYAYQRYEHEKRLRMTRQEVKEERKQLEGDPMVRSRIRSLQREMARRRMMEEVPKATVVVTNPTHLAIAMRYEETEMETPVVVAKGKALVAARIRELALDHDVPIVEDKPLARAMYDKVEVGGEIPVEFFNAVAEILAYVYRIKDRRAA